MIEYPVLIVVADEHSARFFVRASRRAPIVERLDYAETSDLLAHGENLPGVLIRTEGRTRFKPRSRRSQEELSIFLHRVAALIDEAVSVDSIVGLAIVAPPPVMNGLRDFIASKTRQRIVYETCNGMAQNSLAEIDAAMRHAKV